MVALQFAGWPICRCLVESGLVFVSLLCVCFIDKGSLAKPGPDFRLQLGQSYSRRGKRFRGKDRMGRGEVMQGEDEVRLSISPSRKLLSHPKERDGM